MSADVVILVNSTRTSRKSNGSRSRSSSKIARITPPSSTTGLSFNKPLRFTLKIAPFACDNWIYLAVFGCKPPAWSKYYLTRLPGSYSINPSRATFPVTSTTLGFLGTSFDLLLALRNHFFYLKGFFKIDNNWSAISNKTWALRICLIGKPTGSFYDRS